MVHMRRKKKVGSRVKVWKTHTKLRPLLRRLWYYSPMRREAVKRANGHCEICHTVIWSGSKKKGIKGNMEVDHKIPCGKLEGDMQGFTDRLFCGSQDLQVLCKPCHAEISKQRTLA